MVIGLTKINRRLVLLLFPSLPLSSTTYRWRRNHVNVVAWLSPPHSYSSSSFSMAAHFQWRAKSLGGNLFMRRFFALLVGKLSNFGVVRVSFYVVFTLTSVSTWGGHPCACARQGGILAWSLPKRSWQAAARKLWDLFNRSLYTERSRPSWLPRRGKSWFRF